MPGAARKRDRYRLLPADAQIQPVVAERDLRWADQAARDIARPFDFARDGLRGGVFAQLPSTSRHCQENSIAYLGFCQLRGNANLGYGQVGFAKPR